MLRRVRAGRPWLSVGGGSFVWSRGYAGDVARAVLAALTSGRGAGHCLNLVEEQAASPQVLRRAVAWHLRHPPGDTDTGFSADDAARAAG